MYKSIQQFNEKGIANLENIFKKFMDDPTKFAEMIYGIKDEVLNFALNMIKEEFEDTDRVIRNASERKEKWDIVRTDSTTLFTSIGTIKFQKTLFRNKRTGKSEYLLDKVLKLDKYTRITEDAVSAMLDEACDSCYRKGGEVSSISAENLSKQTTMNKIKVLDFPVYHPKEAKKKVETLYIECDEDHVSLQHEEDGVKTAMPKLIYVHEGVDRTSKRHALKNPVYFTGLYEGSKRNDELWNEILDYIEKAYDFNEIKKIYILGDGAAWIKAGINHIPNSKFAIDKYHLSKYIQSSVSHLYDSAEDAKDLIYEALREQSAEKLNDVYDRILVSTEEADIAKVLKAKQYILNNWNGVMVQMDISSSCSAEGHISHILADRVSSRPLGWCKNDLDKVVRLRAYKKNNGDMLELVRYQKSKEKKVAGLEDFTFSFAEIYQNEKRQRDELGIYYGLKTYTIPIGISKMFSIKERIRGL